MKSKKKWIVIGFILVFAVLWCMRFYQLNDGFRIDYEFPRTYYRIGEKLEFGDNLSYGMQNYNGYAFQVEQAVVYDTGEYMEQLGKTEEDFSLLLPEKVVEVTMTLYNQGTDENGISFYTFELVGEDWYDYFHREFTAYANPVFENDADTAYGLIVLPGDSYTVKLVYSIPKRGRSESEWKHMEKEHMWLEFTIRPENKLVELF